MGLGFKTPREVKQVSVVKKVLVSMGVSPDFSFSHVIFITSARLLDSVFNDRFI